MIIFDDFEKGCCRILPSLLLNAKCKDILQAEGRGNFRKVVTNTQGFTTDDKILTGVNSSLSSQGIEFFNIFPGGP
jgi:hypothetical protein